MAKQGFENKLNKFTNEFCQKIIGLGDIELTQPKALWNQIKGSAQGFEIFLYFENLPTKRKPLKKGLQVFVQGQIRVDAQGLLTKATTRVSHSIIDPNKSDESRIVQGVHFDFDRKPSVLHPVFHAQSDIGTLSEKYHEVLQRSIVNDLVEQGRYEIGNQRIPTTQMDIFSAALMVIADHYFINKDLITDHQRNIFNDLLEMVIKNNVLKVKYCDLGGKFHHESCIYRLNSGFAIHAAEFYPTFVEPI